MRIDGENIIVIRMSEEEAKALCGDLDHDGVRWDNDKQMTLSTFYKELSGAI